MECSACPCQDRRRVRSAEDRRRTDRAKTTGAAGKRESARMRKEERDRPVRATACGWQARTQRSAALLSHYYSTALPGCTAGSRASAPLIELRAVEVISLSISLVDAASPPLPISHIEPDEPASDVMLFLKRAAHTTERSGAQTSAVIDVSFNCTAHRKMPQSTRRIIRRLLRRHSCSNQIGSPFKTTQRRPRK